MTYLFILRVGCVVKDRDKPYLIYFPLSRLNMRHTFCLMAALAITISLSNTCVNAEELFTVSDGNVVNVVDTSTPTIVTRSGSITGLAATESIFGVDYRANGGGIYALGSLGNVYTIDQNSYAATQVGSTLSPGLAGTSFALDFNPNAAGGTLFRFISDTDNNRVIDSTTGGYFGTPDKTPVFYPAGDANAGVDPNIQGIAYDNNVLGSTATQQYGIDANLGILTTVANNAGTLASIGSLGLAGALLTDEVAFDISGDTGIAYASLQTVGGTSQLYEIDLTSGNATLTGVIGGGATVRDFTVIPTAAIPEPSSLALFGVVLTGLVTRRRRG